MPVVQHCLMGVDDLVPLNGQVAFQAGVDQVGVAGHYVVVVQLVGAPAESPDAGQLAVIGGLDAVLDPLDFLFRGRLFPQLLQLFVHGGFDFGQVPVGSGGDHYHELPGNFAGVVAHSSALGYLLFVNQAAVQAGGETITQHSLQHVQRSIVGVHVWRRRPGDV